MEYIWPISKHVFTNVDIYIKYIWRRTLDASHFRNWISDKWNLYDQFRNMYSSILIYIKYIWRRTLDASHFRNWISDKWNIYDQFRKMYLPMSIYTLNIYEVAHWMHHTLETGFLKMEFIRPISKYVFPNLDIY